MGGTQGRTKFVIWQQTILENTAHIISDWKILAIFSRPGIYKASVWIKLAFDHQTGLGYYLLRTYFGEKGVSDSQFKLIWIILIKDWCYSC